MDLSQNIIQQQWMSYGLDSETGNDTCTLTGNRAESSKHVIPAGPANATPSIAANLPEFVTTRGGDDFFVPSLNAIRMIAVGTVDPTGPSRLCPVPQRTRQRDGRHGEQGQLPEIAAPLQARPAERLDQLNGHHADDDEREEFRHARL
ncbi:hypothetical protein X769_23280 [Mesorhizobium sp. LSJC268A00]|nr:hypothetical protein X769_23280 [Mesorhizobium sp. LSJC268A00]ESZ11754.1 hypothetical protein X735_24600 [Mesorhizobium sp. L2C085B000]